MPAGDRQVILTHRQGGKGGRLLDIGSLDKREAGLDLLQRPARTHQAQQMLHREPVPADTRLATHLAGLDGDAVKTFDTADVPPQRGRAMRPHTGLEGGVGMALIHARDPEEPASEWWELPGGGISAGETRRRLPALISPGSRSL